MDIAANGEEALATLQQAAYDAVLMDIQMPRMDGYEATRRIRREARFSSLPVIAMTAHAMKGDDEKCLAAGMDRVVVKPARLTILGSGSVLPLEGFSVEKVRRAA